MKLIWRERPRESRDGICCIWAGRAKKGEIEKLGRMLEEKAKEKRGHWQERTKRKKPRRMVKERKARKGKAKGGSGKEGERKAGKGRGKEKGVSGKAGERKAGKG